MLLYLLLFYLQIVYTFPTPSFTSIQGLNGADPLRLRTAGNEQIQIQGLNFGSGCSIQYTGPSPYRNGLFIRYTPLIISQTNTSIVFQTVAGIGANLQFTLTTSQNVSTTSNPIANYAIPNITGISVPVGVSYTRYTFLPTGGNTILLNVTNLGPLTFPGVVGIYTPTVRFGGSGGTYGYMYSCSRSVKTADSMISCLVPVGGGTNHSVRIQSGATGQWSNPDPIQSISYITPTLVSTSTTFHEMNTAGGDQIVFRGIYMPYPSWVIANLCLVSGSFGSNKGLIQYQTDMPGGDLVGFPISVASYNACDCLCRTNLLCRSWAFDSCNTSSCWLKGSTLSPNPNPCRMSSIIQSPPFLYKMTSCTGAFDSDGKTPVITCLTPPGTGTGYTVSLRVAGFYTNLLMNTVTPYGYAPPVLYSFQNDVRSLSTVGNQTAFINGANFGNTSSLVQAFSTLELKETIQGISNVTFSSICNISIPNVQIGCVVPAGVGADLTWSVLVDGQNNVNPTTTYSLPEIDAIAILNATDRSKKIAASPFGGDLLYFYGSGFGYPALNLIQNVSILSATTVLGLTNYTLVSDSLIVGICPQGAGSFWSAQVRIADRLSVPSTANFSFGNSFAISISPSIGTTAGGISVSLIVGDLVYTNPKILTGIVFGNSVDNSLLPYILPTTFVFPNQLLFVLPPGSGSSRMVRLLTYWVDLVPDIAVTPLEPYMLFSYLNPFIQSVVLSNAFVGYSLTVYGQNFGPAPTLTSYDVQWFSGGDFVNASGNFLYVYSSWQDTQITLSTNLSSAQIRLAFVSLDPFGNPTTQYSNTFSYSNLSPLISVLGNYATFPTIGRVPIVVTAQYLASAKSLNLTLGIDACLILDPDTYLPTTDIYGRILQNPEVYSPPGVITSNTVWTFSCLIPTGQGSSVPLQLTRLPDGGMSNQLSLSYSAPSLFSVGGQPYSPEVLVSSPTIGKELILTGANFGPCPTVTLGTYVLAPCVDGSGVLSSDQTQLRISIPAGEGTNWSFVLYSGDQPSPPILFGWLPPTLMYVNSSSLPTTGGVLLRLHGINFGQELPNRPEESLSPSLQPFALFNGSVICPNFLRLSHVEATCILPEGAGRQSLLVSMGGQTSAGDFFVSYDAPRLFSVGYNGTEVWNATISSDGGLVYVRGMNFGPTLFGSCVYMRADLSMLPICDGMEDFSGEGEVFSGFIQSWNHTVIAWNSSAGTGQRSIYISVFGIISSVNTLVVSYTGPTLTNLSLHSGPTVGGYPVTLWGKGFGWKQQSGLIYPLPLPLILRQAYSDPVRVWMDGLCLSSIIEASCISAIQDYTDTTILFQMVPGVGTGFLFQVGIRDKASDVRILWRYDIPKIVAFTPNPIYISDTGPTSVTIQGENFGSQQTIQLFPLLNLTESVVVNGVVEQNVLRIAQEGMDDLLSISLETCPAGLKTVAVTIDGQTGFLSNTSSFALRVYCQQGFFGHAGESCLVCPIGSICSGQWKYPVALNGFFNLNSSYGASCPTSNMIEGRDVCIVPCSPSSACIGNNLCAAGYVSTLPYYRCNACAEGYYKRSSDCIPCPGSPYLLIVGFFLVILFLVGLGYVFQKYNVNVAFVSIAVDYFQVISIFLQLDVQWPPSIKNLMYILSAFNFNLDIVAPECLIPKLAYAQKFYFIEGLPLGLLVCLLFWTGLELIYRHYILKHAKKDVQPLLASRKSLAFLILYFFYLYITRTILDVYNCQPTVPPSYDAQGKVIKYLSVTFEPCGVPGGTQLTLLPYSIVAFVLYSFGYPFLMASAIYSNRDDIVMDQLLRAKQMPSTLLVRTSYSRLYYQYKPDFFYWSLCIVLRKFLIAITAVLFSGNAPFQMAACLLILFLAYVMQTWFNPFMCYSDYASVLESHGTSILTSPIHHRVSLRLHEMDVVIHHHRFQKNIMSHTGSINKAILFERFGSWIFNYNTVEATMLFSGIIVCLMGIMYENYITSNLYDPSGVTAITVTLFLSILGSIFYLLAVFGIEIFLSIFTGKQKKMSRLTSKRIVLRETQLSAIEMNPMMKEKGFTDISVDAYVDSPPKEIWMSFKHIFQSQKKLIQSLMEENKVLKQTSMVENKEIELLDNPGRSFKRKSFSPIKSIMESKK